MASRHCRCTHVCSIVFNGRPLQGTFNVQVELLHCFNDIDLLACHVCLQGNLPAAPSRQHGLPTCWPSLDPSLGMTTGPRCHRSCSSLRKGHGFSVGSHTLSIRRAYRARSLTGDAVTRVLVRVAWQRCRLRQTEPRGPQHARAQQRRRGCMRASGLVTSTSSVVQARVCETFVCWPATWMSPCLRLPVCNSASKGFSKQGLQMIADVLRDMLQAQTTCLFPEPDSCSFCDHIANDMLHLVMTTTQHTC